MSGRFDGFPADTFGFLADLAANNDRDWFTANRKRYEASVLEPSLAFVRAMAPRLEAISPTLVANDRKVGGSMTRLNRDVRFSADKSPYHTHVGFRFAHGRAGKGAMPGFYCGLHADRVVLGTGVYRPDGPGLARIRERIAARPDEWRAAGGDAAFQKTWGDLDGESLTRPPRGFDADHPAVEDLKRKDFVSFLDLPPEAARKKGFDEAVAKRYASSRPLVAFLAAALDLDF